MSDPSDFISSVKGFLAPGAVEAGFSTPLWVPRAPEEALAIYRGSPFDLLVYCAGGHGVNMTVTVTPEGNAKPNWNPCDEIGLGWFSQALGLAPWISPRYGSSAEREAHIQELCRRLPEFVSAARPRGAALWSEVRELVRSSARPGANGGWSAA